MRKLFILTSHIFILLTLTNFLFAQECKLPEIVFNKNADNIFTEEQEEYLGEAVAQQVQKDFSIIEDERVNQYVSNIGDRIIEKLPPTNIKFQFYVVDLPVVNAFAMPGGRIYLTRKLIAFVENEDELAGIIAHELGHGIVRHVTISMSKDFKKVLGVEKMGDRKDVFDKYNEFIDKRNTKTLRRNQSHVGKDQLEADNIGVYAMTAAGYNPKYFSTAYDRIAQTEGKTGSWFSDLFGATTNSEKRLREVLAAVEKLPEKCIAKKDNSPTEKFEDWQTYVISLSAYERKERIAGLMRRQSLTPGLRDSINHLAFSRDGKYIIAQDDSSIFVLQKEPYKFLFRINSSDANNADFTPDSKSVIFNTPGMRVEKWNIAEQKPQLIKEVFQNRNCFQTALSNDGTKLVCLSYNVFNRNIYIDLKLSNLLTNEVIAEKKRFFRPHPLDFYRFQVISRFDKNAKMFQTEFSPDDRHLVIGRTFKREARTQVLPGGGGGGFIRDVKAGSAGTFGYDFQMKKEIEIGSDLRDIIVSPFTFVSNNKIIGQDREKIENSGVFDFPTGKRQEKIAIKANSFSKPHKGNFVIIRPLKVAPVGVYDLSQKKLIIANKTSAFDVYGDVFVAENKLGELGLYSLKDDKLLGMVQLPKSRFGNIRSLNVSPDLNWIAVSDKDRGGVWSLYSGKRYFFVQGFRGAYFDSTGNIYADFAKTKQTQRQVAVMSIKTKGFVSSKAVNSPNTTQYGQYLVSLKRNTKKKKNKKSGRQNIESMLNNLESMQDTEYVSQEEGTLEVRDVKTSELLWSREFEDELPRRYFSQTGKTVSFMWNIKSDAAKNIIKTDEKLAKKAAVLRDKDGDYLIQSVNTQNGEVIGQTLIETGEGSYRIRRAETVGDWLALVDTENRVLLYSLADGELKQRFFGGNFTVNGQNNTIAIGNLSGQLSVYSLNDGRIIRKMSFDSPIAYSQYGKYGKKLFVLTTKQEAFILDTSKFKVARIAKR